MTDWFETLTGFREGAYEDTRRQLEVRGDRLHSKVGGRSWAIGRLETPSVSELREAAAPLAGPEAEEADVLRDKLRIGLHWNVEATEADEPRHLVSQALCSALPVSYTDIPRDQWQTFGTLIREGAYEATLWASVLNAHRQASPTVYLTRVGGGAFGNDTEWIDGAIRRALRKVEGVALDVRIVSYRGPGEALKRLVREFR